MNTVYFYLLKNPNTVNYKDGHNSKSFQRTSNLVANIRTDIKQLQKSRKFFSFIC